MAIYEFECQACGKHFDLRMLMLEHDKLGQSAPVCPECGKSTTRHVVAEFACKTPAG